MELIVGLFMTARRINEQGTLHATLSEIVLDQPIISAQDKIMRFISAQRLIDKFSGCLLIQNASGDNGVSNDFLTQQSPSEEHKEQTLDRTSECMLLKTGYYSNIVL
ncbi:hypothetical protein Y032_0640g1000 [Ancylostoma ceylanicum]|nr:hypothetical protein Y032_0640g1000 [Ancylostoma ceylanicum]